MKTPRKYIMVFLFLAVAQTGCENPSGPPPMDLVPEDTTVNQIPPSQFRVLGMSNAIKEYYYTVSDFIQGTQTPTIVPPDSLKPFLMFPESLYTKGIFVYGHALHECTFRRDTFSVVESENAFNLFSIILNSLYNVQTDGSYHGWYTANYVLVDSNKIYQTFGSSRDLIYQLPLQVGSVHTSSYSGATRSIVSLDTVQTAAGAFSAFRIEVAGRWHPQSMEILWVNPDIGPIMSERHYYITSTFPWDTVHTVQRHQVQRMELVNIYFSTSTSETLGRLTRSGRTANNTGNNGAQQMRTEPLHAFAHGLSAYGRWNEILKRPSALAE